MLAFMHLVPGRASPVFRSPAWPRTSARAAVTSTRMPTTCVTRDVVVKTARLAQLSLEEDEIPKLTKDLERIISLFDCLNKFEVEGVEPMTRPRDSGNVLRSDSSVPFDAVDDIMDGVPVVERDFVRVPKIGAESAD